MMQLALISLFVALVPAKGVPLNAYESMDVKMKGGVPPAPDTYLCTGYPVPIGENYIVQFGALADAGTAHHILLYGCKETSSHQPIWNCATPCRGGGQILYAWAMNAPPLRLPEDVGRHIGSDVGIEYLGLQVHYARKFESTEKPDESGIRIYFTQQRQRFMAGIFLIGAYQFKIPGNTPEVHVDMSCRFSWNTSIIPFGYRTHAHSLGTVIAGYRVSNNTTDRYQEIGKASPQWPQAFYSTEGNMTIDPDDILVARCTFSSIGRERTTYAGPTASDEMCNFYIMYYMSASLERMKGGEECWGNQRKSVADDMPDDASTLPPDPQYTATTTEGHLSGMGRNGQTEVNVEDDGDEDDDQDESAKNEDQNATQNGTNVHKDTNQQETIALSNKIEGSKNDHETTSEPTTLHAKQTALPHSDNMATDDFKDNNMIGLGKPNGFPGLNKKDGFKGILDRGGSRP